MPPSSSGLGYQVLILETGVRLPLGVSGAVPGSRRGLLFSRLSGAIAAISAPLASLRFSGCGSVREDSDDYCTGFCTAFCTA